MKEEGGSVSDNTIRLRVWCVWVCDTRSASDTQDSFLLMLLLFAAGNCWLQQGRNGRCQVLYMQGMSKEECCRSGRLGTSWTEEDVPNSTLFKWIIFNGGAPNCIPCKGGGALIFLGFSHKLKHTTNQTDYVINAFSQRKVSMCHSMSIILRTHSLTRGCFSCRKLR